MSAPTAGCELIILKKDFAVCRFGPKALVPPWIEHGDFWSVSRTPDELSIVCEEDQVPSGIEAEKGLSCLKVVGPLDFSAVGVIASLASALASLDISVFVIATFDTDYLLVHKLNLPDAIDALREAGHLVHF